VLVLIPGSILATVFYRELVFQIQAFASIAMAVGVMMVVKDLPGARGETGGRSLKEYTGLMKDGVKFLFSSRFVALALLGEVVIWSMGTVWWTIILFPLYFAYLFNDIAVSSFRTLVFIPEALSQERSGIWSKRFDPVKWTPRFRLFEFMGFVFNILLAILMFVYPAPVDATNLVGIYIPFTDIAIIEMPAASALPMFLLFVVFIVSDIFGGLAGILTQRVMLDVIPNRIRNSMYSLQPTIAMLLSMPFIIFFGWLLPIGGFAISFALMSIVALVGTVMIAEGFRNPIPRAEVVKQAEEIAVQLVEEMEVT
jgi:hypothetical protein